MSGPSLDELYFRGIELQVAAYGELDAEAARTLYAAYVKRGLMIDTAIEALERIEATTTYVESQSTGMRQHFPTEGAHIAREALAKIRGNG